MPAFGPDLDQPISTGTGMILEALLQGGGASLRAHLYLASPSISAAGMRGVVTELADRRTSCGRRWLAAVMILLLLAGLGSPPDSSGLVGPGDDHLALAAGEGSGAVLPEARKGAPSSHPAFGGSEEFPDSALDERCLAETPASREICLPVPLWLSRQPAGLARPRAPPAS